MAQLIGFLIIIGLIAGGLLSTGADPVLAALPFELSLILRAGFATLLIGNAFSVTREAVHGLWLAVRGPRWSRDDYTALLALLHTLLTRVRRSGHLAIETDIEAPTDSAIFAQSGRTLRDTDALAMVCDTFRLMALAGRDFSGVSQHLERAIDASRARRSQAVSALHNMADALPALGIVAAVLGIIKTMSAIDQSNAVIGAMIATALLGTFLGVFLAYGLVGPLANRFGQVVEDEMRVLELIEVVINAANSGDTPRLAIEAGRVTLPAHLQPNSEALDQSLDRARFVASSAPTLAA